MAHSAVKDPAPPLAKNRSPNNRVWHVIAACKNSTLNVFRVAPLHHMSLVLRRPFIPSGTGFWTRLSRRQKTGK